MRSFSRIDGHNVTRKALKVEKVKKLKDMYFGQDMGARDRIEKEIVDLFISVS